jgi:Protein of unknown function (DUF3060)
MASRDDPEDRIRELERPLADMASGAEMGTPPPPPPSPIGYGGGPFAGPPPTPPSGARVWWIVGAIVAVGVVALAGIIAVGVAHKLSQTGSITLSPSTTTSRVAGSPKTSMRTAAPPPSMTAMPPAIPSTSPPPAPGSEVTINGMSENKSIACTNNAVIVNGISNTITITGHCTSLLVSGMKNAVVVDTADTIEATGLNNQVTYHSGSPKITNTGMSNTVQQG